MRARPSAQTPVLQPAARCAARARAAGPEGPRKVGVGVRTPGRGRRPAAVDACPAAADAPPRVRRIHWCRSSAGSCPRPRGRARTHAHDSAHAYYCAAPFLCPLARSVAALPAASAGSGSDAPRERINRRSGRRHAGARRDRWSRCVFCAAVICSPKRTLTVRPRPGGGCGPRLERPARVRRCRPRLRFASTPELGQCCAAFGSAGPCAHRLERWR